MTHGIHEIGDNKGLLLSAREEKEKKKEIFFGQAEFCFLLLSFECSECSEKKNAYLSFDFLLYGAH